MEIQLIFVTVTWLPMASKLAIYGKLLVSLHRLLMTRHRKSQRLLKITPVAWDLIRIQNFVGGFESIAQKGIGLIVACKDGQ